MNFRSPDSLFANPATLLRWAVIFPLIFAIAKLLAGTVADPDLWGYLAFGRLFWEGGRFPYQDIYAYTPTLNPWVYHEWLTGVLFYPIYQTLGGAGLQIIKYALAMSTLIFIFLTARLRGADSVSAVLCLWGTMLFLELGYSPVRAQVFTYFFFALSLYVLESARLSGSYGRLLILVIIQVPWANLHGGFLAGLGLIGLYALGEAIQRRLSWPLFLAGFLGLLATLINPYGLVYWRYIFHAVTMPRPEIGEWVSLIRAYNLGLPLVGWIYFVTLAIFALLIGIWARWRELTPWLVLGVTLYLGLKHQRHQVFFFLAVGAYLPLPVSAYLAEVSTRPRIQSAYWRLGWAAPCLVALSLSGWLIYGVVSRTPLSLSLPQLPDADNAQAIHYPVEAARYIQTHDLKGRLLTEFAWGEYLLWTLHPACRVALDGRFETVYPEDVRKLYWDFVYGRQNWFEFLEKYPPDLILIDPRSRTAGLLAQEPGWRKLYADAGAVLLGRIPTQTSQP
jgi:hypothetical protein